MSVYVSVRMGLCACSGAHPHVYTSWEMQVTSSPVLFSWNPVFLRSHKEDVKNEISIMNQLSHVNLIQLYDAFESKSSFTLIME